jgi:signal transduction histidine kinase
MLDVSVDAAPDQYRIVLAEYLKTHGEDSLYRCSLLSKALVEGGLGPEDILALHLEALEMSIAELTPLEQLRATDYSHQFLLEVMIAYGVHYRQYLELRLDQATRDAEERARIDQERILEAERLGREREEILAMIAHELRTPIAAVSASIELAERFTVRGDHDQANAQLVRAREGLQRLSRLSADLVEASRGDSPLLTWAEVDVAQVIRQACDWATPAARAKGVELHLESADEALVAIANADALLSVLGNLISNGIRYTPAGGVVRVRHGADGDTCWFEVEDTGIGISPEAQQRVFERFYRAPDARQVEARGLGLGLALVKQMIAAHRGDITVVSSPGEGSRFRVVIPRTQGAREETEGVSIV